jgi:hypothetical protein
MPGRVLNFSEFSSKYSKDQQQDAAASFDTFSTSADNFKEGFDKETYGKPEAGPNRPLSTGSENTPAQPGEKGAPKFNPTAADDTDLTKTKAPAESDEDETPEPEMGANPKEKKKANESLRSLLESYDDCKDCDDGAMYLDQEVERSGPIVICSSCGTQKAMDSQIPEEDPWYSQEFGMQCGCNM